MYRKNILFLTILSFLFVQITFAKDNITNPNDAILRIDEYEASEGKEYFISYNTPDMKYLYGFIRLEYGINNDR